MNKVQDLPALIGLTSADLALASAVVAILSLLLAMKLAWASKLAPPRLIGMASCLVLYTFKNEDSSGGDRFIVPMLWLTNTGARSMLIQELRLIVKLHNKPQVILHAQHTVPREAFESPNTFDEFEALRIGLAPFGGFSVVPGERWVNNLAFSVPAKVFDLLKGKIEVVVQIRSIDSAKFKDVFAQNFHFDQARFEWLRWMGAGGPSVDYFYAEGHPGRSDAGA